MTSRKDSTLLALMVAALLLGGLMVGQAEAARMVPLSDTELDAIYAEGLVIDLQFDVAISEGAEITTNVGLDQVQQLVADGLAIRGVAGNGSTVVEGALLDPSGASVTLNPANGAALLGGAGDSVGLMGSGLTINVEGGDVAIGINIAVFINSTISNSSLYQYNFNFTDLADILSLLQP